MSYKERVITGKAYSRLGTEAEGDANIQRDLEERKTIYGGEVLMPFHAVDRVVMTTAMVDKEYHDPYGCDTGAKGVMVADKGVSCIDCAG